VPALQRMRTGVDGRPAMCTSGAEALELMAFLQAPA
jgi:hypothetical protein